MKGVRQVTKNIENIFFQNGTLIEIYFLYKSVANEVSESIKLQILFYYKATKLKL